VSYFTTTAPTTKAPGTLETELLAAGFKPGAPSHVLPRIVAIDARVYRSGRCGSCGRRGMRFQPYHRASEYHGLATCRHCGAESEA
jgi:hypothetical protein